VTARLNFGDCDAYALAKDSSHPLFFKGSDFATRLLLSRLARPQQFLDVVRVFAANTC
jgi:hypothetical protein